MPVRGRPLGARRSCYDAEIRRQAFIFAVLVSAVPSLADPVPMAAGEVPVPTSSAQVTLAREDLTITVTHRRAEVAAGLWLANGGEATQLMVGFPCDERAEPGVKGLSCRTRIAVRVDGKKVTAALKRTGAKVGHWVWPMRFGAAQRIKLDVAYQVPLQNDRYQTPYFGMGTLYYRLATGASWAGAIGELNMEVRLPTDALVHIAPPGYTRASHSVTWKLTDYEPTQDLAILVHPMYLGRYAAALKAKPPEEALAKLAKQMREDSEEMIRYARFFQDVARRSLGLPEPKDDEVRACMEESARLMETSSRNQ